MCTYSKLNLNTFALSCCIAAHWWVALNHHSRMHADAQLEYSFCDLYIYYMIG